MKTFMRELKTEELEKHVGGINDDYQGTVIHDGGGAGPNCNDLWAKCTGGSKTGCSLFVTLCKY